jgi:hypothetical protein
MLRALAQRALRRAAHPALARRAGVRNPSPFRASELNYGRTTEIGPKTDIGQDACTGDHASLGAAC